MKLQWFKKRGHYHDTSSFHNSRWNLKSLRHQVHLFCLSLLRQNTAVKCVFAVKSLSNQPKEIPSYQGYYEKNKMLGKQKTLFILKSLYSFSLSFFLLVIFTKENSSIQFTFKYLLSLSVVGTFPTLILRVP